MLFTDLHEVQCYDFLMYSIRRNIRRKSYMTASAVDKDPDRLILPHQQFLQHMEV
jgi:hypothetical protein